MIKIKKVVATITVLSFLCSQVGLAQTATSIIKDGQTATNINQTGNTYDINTNTVHCNTGFNSFSDFNVGNGDTANLILPDGTSNLLNMVTGGNKSTIDGTLNAYKNGKVGGNVFFLNPNGIMIGATGIVNVGALTLATPTKAYIVDFKF